MLGIVQKPQFDESAWKVGTAVEMNVKLPHKMEDEPWGGKGHVLIAKVTPFELTVMFYKEGVGKGYWKIKIEWILQEWVTFTPLVPQEA